jgi:hypothetical protein
MKENEKLESTAQSMRVWNPVESIVCNEQKSFVTKICCKLFQQCHKYYSTPIYTVYRQAKHDSIHQQIKKN